MVGWNVELKHKIGDVIEVNIKGTVTNCLIIGDFSYEYSLCNNENYVDHHAELPDGSYAFKIMKFDWGMSDIRLELRLFNCYQTLIGDQKVYVEDHEVWTEN